MEAQRESQVTRQLTMLDQVLEALDSSIEKLEHRLMTVARPEAPIAVDEKDSEKGETLVSLAENIQQRRERIRKAVNKLGDLLNRIEL